VPAESLGRDRTAGSRHGFVDAAAMTSQNVDAHPLEAHLELVHERDVHAAVDVLRELGRLGHLGDGDLDRP
jgi:hypothetical protein